MKLYRAEVFDRSFNLVDMSATVSDIDIKFDYLTLNNSETVIPKHLTAHRSDYLVIKSGNTIEYTGIISNIEYADNTTVLTSLPLMSLMDVQVYLDRSVLRSQALEKVISDKLNAVYANSDTYQSLTGFTVNYSGSTVNASIGGDDNLVNLYDVAQTALRRYNIMCLWSIDTQMKKVICDIINIVPTKFTYLNLDVADVIDSSVQIQALSNSFNKIKYYNEDDTTQTVTYYMHSDGTVDSTDSDRLTPVVYCERLAQEEELDGVTITWDQVALGNAKVSMINSSYDNEIRAVVRADTKLIDFGQIGDVYKIIQGATVYTSILTGYEKSDVITMVFGMIRTDLTSILRMEARK